MSNQSLSILEAIKSDDLTVFSQLLPDNFQSIRLRDRSLGTLCVKEKAIRIIEFLVSKDYDFNELDNFNLNALMMAIYLNDFKLVLFLLENGSEIILKNVFPAIYAESPEMIDFLKLKGAEFDFVDDNELTIMHHFAQSRNIGSLISHMMKLGYEIDTCSETAGTPLLLAANSYDGLAVYELLRLGADPYHLSISDNDRTMIKEISGWDLPQQRAAFDRRNFLVVPPLGGG